MSLIQKPSFLRGVCRCSVPRVWYPRATRDLQLLCTELASRALAWYNCRVPVVLAEMPSERSTPPRSSTLRSFTRSKTREAPSPTSPLQRCSRSYFRSSLSASSANLTPQQRSESEQQEDEEEESQLASTATLVGELDFPDVVCKLDGEVNEGERRVQLGLAKFMAVDENARARDVLSTMEKTWGLDRPGALFSLAGGVTNLKLHTVLAQVSTRCTRRCTRCTRCTHLHLLCTSSASPLCRFSRRASPRRCTSRVRG